MNEPIGQIIADRYRVDAFLGKGGMAEVYKVWDKERSVYLAMKILHADLAEDKVFLRRFKREAHTLAKLQHPNIVRFYGLEQSGDYVYMLMDYVEGSTLRKEIFQSKTAFSMERILEILQPICAALYYAHKSGYVHCDVKPANIMIHKNGTIFISDFGIARMTEAATVTMVGAGTPAYMSPEQVRGEDPTPQMDVYALGIVLFEMLTGGERPFTGAEAKTTGSTSEKVRWEQLQLDAPPPSKFIPNISAAADEIVLKCLAKLPANRYLNAMDVFEDLTNKLNISTQSINASTAGLNIEEKASDFLEQPLENRSLQDEKIIVSLVNKRQVITGIGSRHTLMIVLGIMSLAIVFLGVNLFEKVMITNESTLSVTPTETSHPDSVLTNTLSGLSDRKTASPTLSPTPFFLPTGKVFLIIDASSVYLRSGPYIKDPVVSDAYKKGTKLEVIAKYYDSTNSYWFLVKLPNGDKGWLYEKWIKIDSSVVDKIPILDDVPTPSSIVRSTARPIEAYP